LIPNFIPLIAGALYTFRGPHYEELFIISRRPREVSTLACESNKLQVVKGRNVKFDVIIEYNHTC